MQIIYIYKFLNNVYTIVLYKKKKIFILLSLSTCLELLFLIFITLQLDRHTTTDQYNLQCRFH